MTPRNASRIFSLLVGCSCLWTAVNTDDWRRILLVGLAAVNFAIVLFWTIDPYGPEPPPYKHHTTLHERLLSLKLRLFPESVTIHVTTADIRDGMPSQSWICPAALAMARLFPPPAFQVAMFHTHASAYNHETHKRKWFRHSPELKRLVHAIDTGHIHDIEPGDYTLVRVAWPWR